MKTSLTIVVIVCMAVVMPATADGNLIADFIDAARSQIGKTVFYDPSYRALSYPNGDVPLDRGVCTDVVIRAMRQAIDFDLQQHVHEDMRRHFSQYPRLWGLRLPDPNIDHRRVPNLQTFFKRRGWALVISADAKDYRPGDIVTCTVGLHRPHIMIVSDKRNRNGRPFVIHNIGTGVREEDILFDYEISGHFRIVPGTE